MLSVQKGCLSSHHLSAVVKLSVNWTNRIIRSLDPTDNHRSTRHLSADLSWYAKTALLLYDSYPRGQNVEPESAQHVHERRCGAGEANIRISVKFPR